MRRQRPCPEAAEPLHTAKRRALDAARHRQPAAQRGTANDAWGASAPALDGAANRQRSGCRYSASRAASVRERLASL